MPRFIFTVLACGLLLGAGEATRITTAITITFPSHLLVGPKLQTSLGQPELVATWGCAACTGPELLGFVADIAITPDGTVFVLDSFEPAVRRFSVGSEAAVAFGRKGQGPGEFDAEYSIAIVDDGMTEIIDTNLRRLTRLDFDGNFVSSRPLPGFPGAAAYSRADSAWYVAVMDFRRGGSRVVRLADGSEEPQVVGSTDFPVDENGDLSDNYALAAHPDGGYAVGDGELEYRVRWYDAEGASLGDIYRPIERVAKTEAEMQAERERRSANAARIAQRAAAEPGASGRGIGEIEPLKRHFSSYALRYDDAGRLWLKTERGDASTTVFDVFDAAGTYLGDVEVEGDVSRYDIAGEWLVTAATHEDDYPVVRLWRLTDA